MHTHTKVLRVDNASPTTPRSCSKLINRGKRSVNELSSSEDADNAIALIVRKDEISFEGEDAERRTPAVWPSTAIILDEISDRDLFDMVPTRSDSKSIPAVAS